MTELKADTRFMGGMDRDLFVRLQGLSPQPVYEELARSSGGLRRFDDGAVQVLNMADAQAINRHRDILGAGALGPNHGAKRPLIPLDLDGPAHTRYRKVLDPLFAPTKMALLEQQIRSLTDQLIDSFAGDRRADIYEAFCTPLPSTLFLAIMGIPQSECDAFLGMKNDILHYDPFEDQVARARIRDEATDRVYAWFDDEFDRRQASGDDGDGILGELLGARLDGEPLSRLELLDIMHLLLFAGLDTVSASLSCALSWLARNPDVRHRIVADESLWPAAVEELLRYETPVPGGTRYAAADVEINGRTFPKGTVFYMSWAAANLDPAVFPDPLVVNIDRPKNAHIAFASGWHRCIGSHLARVELRVALSQFHRRLPDYEIEDMEAVHYWPLGVRMANVLPLVFRSA